MNQIRGLTRIAFLLSLIILGTIIIFLIGWLPLRYRGTRLPISIIRLMLYILAWAFNVKFNCTEPEKITQDVAAILLETPARFMAAIEVRQRPVLGWLTASADTVYVIREKPESRQKARNDVAESFVREPHPPIVIYPEGKLGAGDGLLPFRYGAFEIAVKNSIPYLLCAIRYSHPEMAIWHGGRGESMTAAVWRFAQFPGPFSIELMPLEPVYPTPADDPTQLAREAEKEIAVAMGFQT